MEVFEVFIPIIFFIVVGAVIAGVILSRHRERMTMLEKGLSPDDIKRMYEKGTAGVNPLGSLKWGMVFVSIGLAVIIGLWLREYFHIGEGIYFALISLFGGVGLISFYSVARKKLSGN